VHQQGSGGRHELKRRQGHIHNLSRNRLMNSGTDDSAISSCICFPGHDEQDILFSVLNINLKCNRERWINWFTWFHRTIDQRYVSSHIIIWICLSRLI
jgi:hypothetical protein